jgi:hypothetical protein
MGLMSCQSHSSLIQVSDFTVMTQDSTKLWIRDTEFGKSLYQTWQKDSFGPDKTKVTLVDSVEFGNLCNRAIHHKSYRPTVSLNP